MQQQHPSRGLYIATFGCQMNVYDSDRMAGLLAPLGYDQVADPEEADLILLNTCSVRRTAEHKVYSYLGQLKELKERRDGLVIGLGGCMAQQEGQRLLDQIPHLDLVFGTGAIDRLPELIAEATAGRRRAVTDMDGPAENSPQLIPPHPGIKAHLTVMRGCDNFCAYCVVPHTRGREHSRPAEEVAAEAAALRAAGVREITLLGQNVNSYADPGGRDFADLLALVVETPGLWRLRFVTSHPKDLSPRLVEAVASQPLVMEQVHLPAQSGSDRILKAMNRRYTRQQYLDKVALLRGRIKGLALGGDIIVGFPGESPADFADTMSLLEQVRYDFLFSFKYSDRPLTRAAKMNGKVGESVKARRLAELQERQREICLEINRSLEGGVQEVLVEGPARRGQGMVAGRARSGRTVNFLASPDLAGRLVRVRITEGRVNSLVGELLPGEVQNHDTHDR